MSRPPRASDRRGAALVAALLLVLLLSATGLGLALSAGLEPAIAKSFEAGAGALNAAEAGLALTAHDLVALPDWNDALTATWCPRALVPPGPGFAVRIGGRTLTAAALTHLANCQHTEACTPAELEAITIDRPWGVNNPVFRFLGTIDVAAGSPPAATAYRVCVWLADDPAEVDGNPWVDGGPAPDGSLSPSPGRDRLVLRAETYGPQGSHAAVSVVLERRGPWPQVRFRTWVPSG